MGRIDAFPSGSPVTAGMIASEAWTSWTPTLGADTTAPTLGTAPTQLGRYIKLGRTVIGNFIIYFGTGATAGSGSYRINLPPVPPVVPSTDHYAIGQGYLYNGTALRLFSIFVSTVGTTWAYGLLDNASGVSFVASGTPWAWAATHRILGSFTYEAVS